MSEQFASAARRRSVSRAPSEIVRTLIGASGSALALALTLTACGSAGGSAATVTVTAGADDVGASASATTLDMQGIANSCGLYGEPGADVGDGGKSLSLDGQGDEDVSGLSIEQIACVLNEVQVPDSITSDIDNTRALDGRQEASWGDYTLVWRYHPDSGLELILTQK